MLYFTVFIAAKLEYGAFSNGAFFAGIALFLFKFPALIKLPFSMLDVAEKTGLWCTVKKRLSWHSFELAIIAVFGSWISLAPVFVGGVVLTAIVEALLGQGTVFIFIEALIHATFLGMMGLMFATILAGYLCDLDVGVSFRGTAVTGNEQQVDNINATAKQLEEKLAYGKRRKL